MEEKKAYYFETYDKDGDWDYHVFAINEDEARKAFMNFCNNQDIERTVHKVHGPFQIEDVLGAKEPSL